MVPFLGIRNAPGVRAAPGAFRYGKLLDFPAFAAFLADCGLRVLELRLRRALGLLPHKVRRAHRHQGRGCTEGVVGVASEPRAVVAGPTTGLSQADGDVAAVALGTNHGVIPNGDGWRRIQMHCHVVRMWTVMESSAASRGGEGP